MNILTTLCDAQNRYATADGVEAVVEIEYGERQTDPRDGLLHALWTVLDADSTIMLRIGDDAPVEVDMDTQVTLVGDVLTLGATAIDLSTQKVEYMNGLARTTQFLIDGVPLRFTYAAGHVDANMEAEQTIIDMITALDEGSIEGIRISIDGQTTTISKGEAGFAGDCNDTIVLGDAFSYDGLNGPLLDGRDSGPIQGLDFDGRIIQIERIEWKEERLAA